MFFLHGLHGSLRETLLLGYDDKAVLIRVIRA